MSFNESAHRRDSGGKFAAHSMAEQEGSLVEPNLGSTKEEAAFEAGVHGGWESANYAEAYGGDPMAHSPDSYYDEQYFEEGFAEGVERFQNGLWPDGTPVDDE